jgi:hypothetical protein
MPTDTVKPVDHSHAHIGVVDQRIRKRHAGGASPTTRQSCPAESVADQPNIAMGLTVPRHANSRTNLRSTLM